MDHAHQFCAVERVGKGLHVQREVLGYRDVAKLDAALLGQHLPRNDVGMVFHFGENDGVPFLQVGSAPSVGDKVDRFGGAAGDDGTRGVEPFLEFRSARLVAFGGLACERVNRSVDVGV